MMSHKKTYGRAWILIGIAAALFLARVYRTELRSIFLPKPAHGLSAVEPSQSGADWFLLVRVPEITAQRESGVDTMRVRLNQWLDALYKADFHPMSLSEVALILERGGKLPQRTVVLFFSPGYRRTCEIVSPIFERHKCPAVILTNEAALKASNRRYLSRHALREIRLNRGWDYGFSDGVSAFTLEGVKVLKEARWSAAAGALALNRWRPGAPLNFLTAKADWLADEFVNRLLVEAPVPAEATLTKATIQAREWGIALDAQAGSSAFDLKAQPQNKGLKLFWLGTTGMDNYRLRMTVASLYGELWLQLRYDEASGDNVRLIFSGHDLLIEDVHENRSRRLALLSSRRSFSSGPFTAEVVLVGGRVAVSVNGKEPVNISGLETLPAGKGVVQIHLVDKVRGTAEIRGLNLIFEPLPAASALENRVSR